MLTFETDFSVQNNLFVYMCLEFIVSFLVEKLVLNGDIYNYRYNTNIFFILLMLASIEILSKSVHK